MSKVRLWVPVALAVHPRQPTDDGQKSARQLFRLQLAQGLNGVDRHVCLTAASTQWLDHDLLQHRHDLLLHVLAPLHEESEGLYALNPQAGPLALLAAVGAIDRRVHRAELCQGTDEHYAPGLVLLDPAKQDHEVVQKAPDLGLHVGHGGTLGARILPGSGISPDLAHLLGVALGDLAADAGNMLDRLGQHLRIHKAFIDGASQLQPSGHLCGVWFALLSGLGH
mmetsp:Transcript_2792/g.8341  ORF Transcript_2792/g.8341 Transcript_2792/m.8341 type:complete len:224 (-) Transcript_2792:1099-1770(-)